MSFLIALPFFSKKIIANAKTVCFLYILLCHGNKLSTHMKVYTVYMIEFEVVSKTLVQSFLDITNDF